LKRRRNLLEAAAREQEKSERVRPCFPPQPPRAAAAARCEKVNFFYHVFHGFLNNLRQNSKSHIVVQLLRNTTIQESSRYDDYKRFARRDKEK